jgi:alanine racemase
MSALPSTRPVLAEVDLGVLAENLRELRSLLEPGVRVIASIKANGYGHGAVQVAETLAREGVELLTTGSFDEAVAVREAGVDLPILMLPGALPDGMAALLRHGLTPTVCDLDTGRAVEAAAGEATPVWVKVESGLGRLGVPLPHAGQLLRDLADLPNIVVEGLYTHLPFVDAAGLEWAKERLAAFGELRRTLDAEGLLPPLTQARSSAGVLAGLEDGCNTVCPGHVLYGLPAASPDVVDASAFRPVLRSVTTRLISVARHPEARAAGVGGQAPLAAGAVTGVVSFGRTDGYRAARPGETAVMLVRGRRAPVRGVSLEHTTLDLTGIEGVAAGDEVVVVGEQAGEALGVRDLAAWQGVGTDDVVLAFDGRTPRRYHPAEQLSAAS